MNTPLVLIPVFMILSGLALAGIWTRDILFNPDIDLSAGFFRARDKDSGSLFWPHWFAEYGTAVGLVAGGTGFFLSWAPAATISLFALGALCYTSLNSLGWAFAYRERYVYGAPMLFCLSGSVASLFYLLLH